MDTVAVRCIETSSGDETKRIAAALGPSLSRGGVVALVGDLGSGKTTFTKGLCAGLGLADERLVSSPTYVLEHVYPTTPPVHHYDSYRLTSAEEFEAVGFRERIEQGAVLVIEWADKVLDHLPPERLVVELSLVPGDTTGTARRLRFSGPRAAWGETLHGLPTPHGNAH